jgi:hypothetical protein
MQSLAVTVLLILITASGALAPLILATSLGTPLVARLITSLITLILLATVLTSLLATLILTLVALLVTTVSLVVCHNGKFLFKNHIQ